MRVTYLADSTFLFEHAGIRLLTDPWIGTRIYGGAWMQFPRPTVEPEDLGPIDAVFISHVHEDHCDHQTLARLDLSRAVLHVMDRSPNFTLGYLERHGIEFPRISLLDGRGAPTEIAPGLWARALEADPAHELNHMLDSSLLLTWGDHQAAFFANDCVPHEATFETLSRFNVRFAALPASGGSGYPTCFDNLAPAEKRAERDRIVTSYLDDFVEAVERIRPARVMACAGNHVVIGLDETDEQHTTYLPAPSIAYRHGAAALDDDTRLAVRVLPLREGETADLDVAQGVSWEAAAATVAADIECRRGFLDAWRGATYDHEIRPVPTNDRLVELFTAAAANLVRRAERRDVVSMTTLLIALDDDGECWGEIDLSTREARVTSWPNLDGPTLRVRTDLRLLAELLAGRFSWNIADASLFLRYDRDPDVYDHHAVIALNWLHTPTAAAEIALQEASS